MRGQSTAKSLEDASAADPAAVAEPCEALVDSEDSRQVARALGALPYEQREAVLLHVTADMRFREIARIQGVSLRTAQGRYRYAMKKLRSTLTTGDEP